MNGGIDSQIQGAMMSAGNNPQALQQRYQQSRSLVDLLALQKLKSEKEAAARDIQMKMQQQPQTIVEQREQELMGMNRQEMMQKMGPTLARTGQESAQRAVQQGQTGIASQAPPQMGMREGGLVPKFSGEDGSLVQPNKTTQALALIKAGVPVVEVIQQLKLTEQEAAALKSEASKSLTYRPETVPRPEIPKTPRAGLANIYELDDQKNLQEVDVQGQKLTGGPSVPPAPEPATETPPAPQEAGIAGALGASKYGNFEPSQYTKDVGDLLLERARESASGEATRAEEGIARILKPVSDINAENEAITAEQRALGDEQTSLERQRRKQLIASLLGGANKRGFGSVMSGVGRAGMAQADANEAAKRDVLATHKASKQIDAANRAGVYGKIAEGSENAYQRSKTNSTAAAQSAGALATGMDRNKIAAQANEIQDKLNTLKSVEMETWRKEKLLADTINDLIAAEQGLQQTFAFDPAIKELEDQYRKDVENPPSSNEGMLRRAEKLQKLKERYPEYQQLQYLKQEVQTMREQLGRPPLSGSTGESSKGWSSVIEE